MCTYSQGVLERGMQLRAVDDMEGVMSTFGCTLDLALTAVGLTYEEWEEAQRQRAERALSREALLQGMAERG